MSPAAMTAAPTTAVADGVTVNNTIDKPKPCCVCKPEKAARDECMLFSTSKNPEKDCMTTIESYRSCMAGFGFKLP